MFNNVVNNNRKILRSETRFLKLHQRCPRVWTLVVSDSCSRLIFQLSVVTFYTRSILSMCQELTKKGVNFVDHCLAERVYILPSFERFLRTCLVGRWMEKHWLNSDNLITSISGMPRKRFVFISALFWVDSNCWWARKSN